MGMTEQPPEFSYASPATSVCCSFVAPNNATLSSAWRFKVRPDVDACGYTRGLCEESALKAAGSLISMYAFASFFFLFFHPGFFVILILMCAFIVLVLF